MPPPGIKTRKQVVDSGRWNWGTPDRGSFPVAGKLPISGQWRWRALRLADDGRSYRLLIMYRPDKGEYQAALGLETRTAVQVLARLEDHGTHPGLHCHAPCERDADIPPGSFKYPALNRAPRTSQPRRTGGWTDLAAWNVALKFYNIDDAHEGELL